MLSLRSTFAACGLALFAGCSAPQVGIGPTFGRLDARGSVAIGEDGAPAIRNELADMGVAGRESTLGLRADLKWNVPHLTLATQGASWSGSGFASELGDITGTDVSVRSDVDLRLHRMLVTFDLIPSRAFELGLGFGISAIDIDWRIRDQTSQATEEVDEILPIPVLALRAGLSIWRVDLEALLSGFSLRYDGNKADYLDADLSANLRLFEAGRLDGMLAVGYRRVALDLEVEDDDDGDVGKLDLTFDGPYVGLRIRF